MSRRFSDVDVAVVAPEYPEPAGNLRCALRLAHFGVLVFTVAPLACLLGLASDYAMSRDPGVSSTVTQALLRFRVRFLRWCCRWATLVCGIRVDFEGSLKRARQGLILANHISYLDVVAIGSIFPCGFVAKREIASWPLIGAIARGLGCVFLDRNDLGSRVRTLQDLRKLLVACDMCVFPEGTTTASRSPCGTKWRTGQTWSALAAARGVLAVAVSYSDHARAVWTDDAAFLPHLIALLKRGPIAVRIDATKMPMTARESASLPPHARVLSRAAHAAVTDLCAEPQPLLR